MGNSKSPLTFKPFLLLNIRLTFLKETSGKLITPWLILIILKFSSFDFKFLIKFSSLFFTKIKLSDFVNLLFFSKFKIGEKTSRDSISGFKLKSDFHVATKFILSATISMLLLSSINLIE